VRVRVLHVGRASENGTSTHTWPQIGQNWRRLFQLRPDEASFEVRGFPVGSVETQARLQHIGETFIAGFNRALCAQQPSELREAFEIVAPEDRGFAVEGAAMGCAIADAVMFGGNRLHSWIAYTTQDYGYLTHVGAGWALARVPWRRRAILRHLDPVHSWLAFDGLGFHDGYFYPRRIAAGWRRLTAGYAARAYDQGVGRAAWFSSGGSIARAAAAIARLDGARHNDLWAGLGLAVGYAGGATAMELQLALLAAADARVSLAQGAAFAAEARARAGHVPTYTSEAVRILSGLDVEKTMQLVRRVRQSLPSTTTGTLPNYELWRLGVQRALAAEGGTHHG
jgi:hypothetical protein